LIRTKPGQSESVSEGSRGMQAAAAVKDGAGGDTGVQQQETVSLDTTWNVPDC